MLPVFARRHHCFCCCLQRFVSSELAKHLRPGSIEKIAGSKRQLTFFLSYMSHVAAFWSATVGLRSNETVMHLGSVLFEQLIIRSIDLCDAELRKNWKEFPHQFLVLLDNELRLLTTLGLEGFGHAEGYHRGIRGKLVPDRPGGSAAP